MGFFKNFFSSCLGALVALFVFTGLIIYFFVALASQQVQTISDNSVLHLKLNVPITELESEDPVEEFLPGSESSIGLMQLKQALRYAKTDEKIKGILLNTPITLTGMSTLEEIRSSLQDFRSSGKWVIAYADSYSEGAYYIASVADKIYLGPHGMLEFNGLATDVAFFKRLFDKLEIKPEVFRVGEFKSAVEPFLRDNLSEENKLQLNEMLQSIHTSMLQRVSEARNIPVEKLRDIADHMLVRNARQAVSYGLADSLAYIDQVKDDIRKRLNIDDEGNISFVKYAEYRKSILSTSTSKNEIAVIVADGDIMPGESSPGSVGAVTIREAVRKARINDKVKAIVIRVNSPGGAFEAADEMWREIALAAEQKPVIASMGDYAASGGYYIAMPCDSIVALPTTVTGSIGIFSVLFDLSAFLENRIGITTEEVKTGEVGELITFNRPLTTLERDIWQTQTNELYEVFVSKAAQGRNMALEDLKKVASGRVWTGTQAVERKLADVTGDFETAVKIAASSAGVGDDYKVRFYPKPKTTLDWLFGSAEETAQTKMLQYKLGDEFPVYKQWQRIKKYQGAQARMPLEFQIK